VFGRAKASESVAIWVRRSHPKVRWTLRQHTTSWKDRKRRRRRKKKKKKDERRKAKYWRIEAREDPIE
jgi:hypothetical protein